MNTTLTFSLNDPGQLRRLLEERVSRFKADSDATMRLSGQAMMEQVSELSPFDTGFMSANVTYTPLADDRTRGNGFVMGETPELGFTVGWHAEDFAAKGLPFYPVYQEFGTIHHAAQPSLGPVGRQSLPLLKRDIEAVYKRSFR
jgi:hypothetical protein